MSSYRLKFRFLFFIAALLLSWESLFSSTRDVDTLLYFPSASRMTVISKDTALQIDILNGLKTSSYEFPLPENDSREILPEQVYENPGKKLSSIFRFHSLKDGRYWALGMGGVCLGLSNATGAPAAGFQWSKSIEVGWMSVVKGSYFFGNSSISLGVGINWKNFKISTSDKYLLINENGNLCTVPYPDDVKGKFSRLKIFSVQLPLLYSYYFGGANIGISLGTIVNINSSASLLTAYIDADDHRIEMKQKIENQRPVSVDFWGNLSFRGLMGVYVRYSPQRVMTSMDGVNFKSLTIGLSIFI